MKTGNGRGGWLGQGGRHGHCQGHEEGPKRGSSRLADKVTDMENKAGLIQQEMIVRTSDFDVAGALAVRAYFLVSGCTGGWVQYISLGLATLMWRLAMTY